jgi:hypothetical protein
VPTPRERRLKKGTRDLVDLLGGSTGAAKTVRQPGRQPRISNYTLNNCDAFAPIDLIVELEEAAAGAPGAPFAVRAMAYELGFELFKLPSLDAVRDGCAVEDWSAHLASIAQEAGDLIGRLGAALADKTLNAAERRDLIRDARELVTVAVTFLTALEAGEA